MRLIDLEIHNIRGIRELKLNPGGKNLVVMGPNGAGKSAVVDAIDFLLSGNISRLSGKGTARITLKKHGAHLSAKPKDVWVKARVSIDGQEIEISRCLANDSKLDCPDEYRPKIRQITQLARLGHHVLTRREILRFVNAESSERAREIQALLDIQEIDKIRLAINSAVSTINNELKSKKRAEDEARNTICAAVGISVYDPQIVLEKINTWRAILGGAAINHNPIQDISRGLQRPGSVTHPLAINLVGISRHIETIGAIFSESSINQRVEQYARLQEAMNQVQANPHLIEDLKALELIQIGQSLLDPSGRCPLCQVQHPQGYLHEFLGERLRHAHQARQIQATIQEMRDSLEQANTSIRLMLGDLLQAAQSASLTCECDQIEQWLQINNAFTMQAEADRENFRLSQSRDSYASLDLPKDFPHRLEEIYTALETSFPPTTLEDDAWEQLIRLEVHLQNYDRAVHACQASQQAYVMAQILKIKYETARDGILETLYRQVCERFTELYQELHGEDESDFCAQLAPAGAGIDFRVDFHGHGTHPPHALHSEGHQDSMGVCLFLALAERLTQGKLDLIVLDDVVMSVDIGHRRQLADLLARKFTHRQFLITTHDRVWATQLRNAGMVSSKGIVQFYGWDFDSGPLLTEITSLWEQIEQDLRRGEVSPAAARLRRGLEEFSYHACDSLQARVRFAMDGRWELGDLLPAAIEQYKYWLKKAKVAANSWNKVELVAGLAAHDETVKAIIAQRDIHQWMINPSVHYSAWASLTPSEFRQVVDAYRDLVSLFYCAVCGNLIFVVEEDNNPSNVRCQCSEFNWNLVERMMK